MNTEGEKIQWHPAFDAALQIELGEELSLIHICITGGTIALAVIIFVGMVFMEENETQNNSIETVSQTESDTQTEEAVSYTHLLQCKNSIIYGLCMECRKKQDRE